MPIVDSPLSMPAKKFTTDDRAHKSNVKAIEDFAQTIYNQLVPTGSIMVYAGSTAPSGWLLCDGTAISRSTYYTLFQIIGTAYGVGDGSTTCNLPNLTGKHPTQGTLGTTITHTHPTVTTGVVSTGTNSADSGYGLNFIIKA